jgi:trimeric autotransporter adhesin
MSTKTTFKRVALVAVAALGFGMLSVVPSTATARTAASIVVGDIPASRVGQSAYVPVKVYLPSGTVAADTITINAEITAAPIMGGAANAASAFLGGSDVSTNDSGASLALTDTSSAATFENTTEVHGQMNSTRSSGVTTSSTGVFASKAPSYIIQAADISAGYIGFNVRVTPDVAGSYSVLVSTNAGTTGSYTAGDANASFTLTTGGAPTGVTLTTVGGSSLNTAMTSGVAVAVSLVGGTLSGIESINLTTSGSGTISKDRSSYATTAALTATDFTNGKKIVWLKSPATASETISLTATGSAGVPTSVTATKTYAVQLGAGSTSVELTLQAPNVANTATTFYAATNAIESTNTITVTEGSTSQKIGYTTPASMTEQYGFLTVTDTAGTITGVAGLIYDIPTSFAATTAASGGSWSFAASGVGLPAGTTLFTVAIPTSTSSIMGIDTGVTKTFVTAARTNSTFTVTPSATINAAPAAAVALSATLKDQFGVALPNVVVTITTSGRNNPAATTATTDASGIVTFTTADASTSTTALTDTVTFSASGATSSAVTINYANTAVGTVTVTGGNTTASVNALVNTVNGISVGSSTTGAEAGAITITATVKDALGNAMAGVPVSFTVAGTGVAFTSTSATKYTGATGTAAGSLYAWTAGTYTYTVTAGGKTTTGTATFGSIAAGNTRVVSATVSGNVVTGKAVDRFGNPVKDAVLYASTSGSANIGGVFIKDGTTAADGTVSWVVTGNGDVTVSAVNPTSVAGTTAYQTAHLAGNATLASATVAAVAYGAATVGTATTAEKNVGSTFAPAGVASAKVTVTEGSSAQDAATAAADAAAEATDAANAATDAANAAAEAADAATAAAQDAADAVAALSTQVSEMVDALKKQITALTNLVIKIQKKVKA